MIDWRKIAQARGLELGDAPAQVLDALERDLAPLRESLDWPDEPVLEFHAELD